MSVLEIRNRQRDAGFTLIETLVALAILAMSAVALLSATEAHIARIGALENRAAAGWVVENQLAELSIGLGTDPDPAPMLGIAFAIDVSATPTSDPDLQQVDIRATDPVDGRVYGRLTGFIDLGGQGKAGAGLGG